MNIERIAIRQLKMPLKCPFETSFGRMSVKEFLLVSVAGDGHVGHCESVAMPYPLYSEEATGTVNYVLENFLIPLVFQHELTSPSDLAEHFAAIRRNNMAKAALEGAIWDLYCKQKGISLAQGLGGVKDEVEVGVSIGIEASVEELLQKVGSFLEQGYKKIKVKIKPGWDIEPIRAIRATFGADVPLMVDANSAYSLEDISIFQELDQFQLMMIEQPLAHDDIIDHAKLQARLQTPICLDESIHSAEDARKAIELNSCQIINIKIGRVGGLTESRKIHDLCQQYQVPVWCGGMLEAGVGRAHNIAITSLSNFTIPGDTSVSERYWEQDIVQPPVQFSKPGMIEVPKGPGIGYEVDEEALNKYTVAQKEFTRNMLNV